MKETRSLHRRSSSLLRRLLFGYWLGATLLLTLLLSLIDVLERHREVVRAG